MSYLFEVRGKILSPNVETLCIYPFSEIWERDKSLHKENAIEDFKYIEFVTSMKKTNPYRGYDEDVKKRKVKAEVITQENWEEDEYIKEGINKVIEFQEQASVTYSYFMAAKSGAEKLKSFFMDFNMTDKNFKTGLPIYKPKEITAALTDTLRVLENLNSLQDKVDQEVYEIVKNRGQKQISVFADQE